jgi:hypothetical protein
MVPLAVPLPPRLFDQVTRVTPTLSLAVPDKVTVPVVVVKLVEVVGPWIVTTGTVASAAALMVQVKVRAAVSEPSDTIAVTLKTPVVVGVPLIRPVDDATERPFGRPCAK